MLHKLVFIMLFATMAVTSFASELTDPDANLLTIPHTDRAPIIDGVIEPGEWDIASTPLALVDTRTGSLAKAQSRFWLCWDAERLYIAGYFPLPQNVKPRTDITTRDGNVWEDDAVEIFINPANNHTEYYQLITNAVLTQWDSKGTDGSWNAAWHAASDITKDAWSIEIQIPFAGLRIAPPSAGDVWGMNIVWDRQTPGPLTASWAPLTGALHTPGKFCHIKFSDQKEAYQLSGPQVTQAGTVKYSGTWKTSQSVEAKAQLLRLDADNTNPVGSFVNTYENSDQQQPILLEHRIPVEDSSLSVGSYRINVTISSRQDILYNASIPWEVPSPMQMTLRRYPLAGILAVDVDTTGLGIAPEQIQLTGAILDTSNRIIREFDFPAVGGDYKSSAEISIEDLSPGTWQIKVSNQRQLDMSSHSVMMTFNKLTTPDWLNSQEGQADIVLPPWTPVQVRGDTARVWGREYEIGDLPFPSEIVTQEQSILAGPIMLKVVADNQDVTWQPLAETGALETKPTRAVFTAAAEGNGVRCEGTAAVEYDGMIRSDFSLLSTGAKTLNHVSLVIPVKEEYATFLYHFPGEWGSTKNARILPEAGWESTFKPYITLCNDNVGLAWFSESDRGFSIVDSATVINISRESGVVTLEINIIDQPVHLDEPLNYTFGFHATPVKPLQPDAWDYRICHEGSFGIENREYNSAATITYPAEGQIDTKQGTFEAWVRPQFNLNPENIPTNDSRGKYNHALFTLKSEGGELGFYWNIDDKGMRVYTKRGLLEVPFCMSSNTPLTEGKWHHVAFTWSDKIRIFIDGVLSVEKPWNGTIEGGLAGGEILVGTHGDTCDFDIDSMRISSVPRESFDLNNPVEPDDKTLLLDRFEAVDGQLAPPEVGKCTSVSSGEIMPDGMQGTAYALYTPNEKKIKIIDKLAQMGVRTVAFHEHWTDIQNYPRTIHDRELRSVIDACHDRNMKFIPYFGYELSNIAPEWTDYSDEVLTYPRAGGYTRQPEQIDYICCYNSGWQDFLADGIGRMMDEYDIDGVYLDGTAYPWACANEKHGCGYRKTDGTLVQTWPIFAYRDMMRRIYTLVKTRKADGIVNVHNSTLMVAPTLAWATSTWDGEQISGIDRMADPLSVIPLDAFRCEFAGRSLGVPAEFLCYNRPYTYPEALSLTLLHDIPTRGYLGGGLELEAKIWKVMEDFKRSNALWMPYWETGDYVKTDSESVKVSLYSRSSEGALLVVSNLGNEHLQTTVQIDLEGLALPQTTTATDAMTDIPLTMSDGNIALSLKRLDFKLIWLKPGN